MWHSNDKYKKVVYRCNRNYEKSEEIAIIGKLSTVGKICTIGIITEEEIKSLFVEEYNKLDVSKAIKNAKEAIKNLTDTDSLDGMLKEEKEKAISLANQINELIDKNSRVAMNQKNQKRKAKA